MASYNKVILIGNLTRDPELRYTPKGTAVAKISLAVNRTWKTETGESKEEVTFVDIDAFGRQAEVIGQFMKKGRPFMCEGRLKLETWDDKQTGQKRSRLGVVLEAFTFIDSGGAGAARGEGGGSPSMDAPAPSAPRRPAPSAPRPMAAPAPSPDEDMPPAEDDDVPF